MLCAGAAAVCTAQGPVARLLQGEMLCPLKIFYCHYMPLVVLRSVTPNSSWGQNLLTFGVGVVILIVTEYLDAQQAFDCLA